LGSWLAFRRISAVYIFILMFVIFTVWVPHQFLSWSLWRSMLDIQGLNALAAIAVVIPLAAGQFDLAVGSEVGFATVFIAYLIAKADLPVVVAIVVMILTGALVGVASGILVVRARIESLIATLGVSAILLAGTEWVSGGSQILGLSSDFDKIATKQILGLTVTTWTMIVVALISWYLLELTPIGRRVYATGGNINTARLAGVRTGAVIMLCFAAGGAVAALAGVLETSRLATGDPTIGSGFLLPAFAAAMLGSTQFRPGRYNVWGAVFAVYFLSTGITGLQLGGAPAWIPDLFNGVALLLAVGLAVRQRGVRRLRRSVVSQVDEPQPADPPADTASRSAELGR
jgi:ribose transport system permease protein